MPTDALALQRLYHWERHAPGRVVLTQPLGGGATRDYAWAQLVDESRRMAAHLQSLGFQPGSRIAILSKKAAAADVEAKADVAVLACLVLEQAIEHLLRVLAIDRHQLISCHEGELGRG